MAGCVVDTLSTLKALTGTNKFNGLALVVFEKKAWYICDIASVEAADNDNIVMPDDGIGRWIKCNNESNILNSGISQSTTGSPTVVDFTNYEEVQLLFTQDTVINFPVTLRNGYAYLILNRNAGLHNVTSWDARIRFTGTSYNFSSGTNVAILTLVFFNNIVYVTKVVEYV